MSFYCPQSFQKSLRSVGNWLSCLLGKLYRKHHRTRAFTVVPSTRLFNILCTVFSLQWLPCLFLPPFEFLLLPLSLSLSFHLSIHLLSSLLPSCPFVLSFHCPRSYPFNYFPSTFRKLASVHFFCDFIATLNNRRFLLLALVEFNRELNRENRSYYVLRRTLTDIVADDWFR